jgi:hypothetical protein
VGGLEQQLLIGRRQMPLALWPEQCLLQQRDLLAGDGQRFVLRRNRGPLLGDDLLLLGQRSLLRFDRGLLRGDVRLHTREAL